MKRAITTLTLLCGGLLFITPVSNTIFAQSTNNKPATELVKSMDENTTNEVKVDKEEIEDKNTVEVIDVLNQEQAKELLEMYNKDVNYTFQGDENTFEALSQKGLSGYVFFPDYDTDLGFFVDKNTASIYYFHPSGYLKLAI